MSLSRRQQYLQAIGIDVWVARGAAAEFARAEARAPTRVGPAVAVATAATPTIVPTQPKLPVANSDELWRALKAEVASCTKCALHATRTQTVFGVGDSQADWMVIGEAPGAEEDRRGEPFVGAAGLKRWSCSRRPRRQNWRRQMAEQRLRRR